MKILLEKPELEKFIDEKVRSGSFGSAEEVIEAGLARLKLGPPPPFPWNLTLRIWKLCRNLNIKFRKAVIWTGKKSPHNSAQNTSTAERTTA